MKISFVTATLTSGGSERVMSIIANQLQRRGYAVEIINLNQHIVFYPIDKEIRLSFVEDEVGKSLIAKLRWLRNHVKESRPDVVIPFMEAVYCFTLLALVGINVPVISSERIDPRKSPFLRNILRRIFLPLTTYLVVQTRDIFNFYPSFIQKKCSVIYNPVTEEVFKDDTEVSKLKRIINVGKLDYQKNQKMLIEAFSKVAPKFPDFQLYIFGEGPLRNNLESLVKQLGLTEKVFLPGRSTHIIDELRKSSIFCFSSDFEGMSNALIEAICVGLPIVTTNVSGTNELIQRGENGYIIPVGDVDKMCEALKSLMRDQLKREDFGLKNKEKGNAFRVENIVNQWEQVIIQVVKKYKEAADR